MEACLDILEEAKKIFLSIEEVEVLNEVISDTRGIQYLEGDLNLLNFNLL